MKKVLAVVLMTLAAVGVLAGVRGGTLTVVGGVAAHGKPTVALANLGAGLITNGTHEYKQTWVNAGGETLASPASASVTTATATNGKVNITIPELPADAVSANLYRTKAGAGTWYLLATGLAPGVYVDNIADGSLPATEEPVADTSSPTVAAPAAPTVALANLGAGLVTTGSHLVKVAFLTSYGVNTPGTASDAVVTDSATNGKVVVSVTASTNPAVTGARIYMTKAGGSTYYAAGDIANTTGDYTVNVADASLTVAALTTDTSVGDTIIEASPGKQITYLWLRNNHGTEKVWLGWSYDDEIASPAVATHDWLAANGGTLELTAAPSASGLKRVRLRGETTAPTVTYRVVEQ